MRTEKRKRRTLVFGAVILNVILIFCVILSVVFSFREAEKVSFSQNIENVRTLTDTCANKVELEIMHYREKIENVSNYVNGYNGIGMTEEEMCAYFEEYFGSGNHSWQLVNKEAVGASESSQAFYAISLCSPSEGAFSYRVQAYPELAKIFCAADESGIGVFNRTSEFTDSSPSLSKCFAVTTTVRLIENGGYTYKTLMFLVESSYINNLLASNNDIDTLSFFDYSGIIIDDNGNYVISSRYFQGTNLNDYIALYNDEFTSDDAQNLCNNLVKDNYTGVLYYQNNREQDCVYTIVPVQNSSWHLLSIVPIESFHNTDNYSSSYLRFFLSFLALFIVDMTFVLMLNRQLRRKKKEAEAASYAKSQFLSSMSHDIRTPMNAIIGMTVIANDNLEDGEPDKETLKDCIKTIELSGNHLLTLINDILDISKIESGKVALSPEDFSISETLSKMLEIIQPQIKEKNFDFKTHIVNVNHEFVHADELRINQIFINILSNAVKYTNPYGKITVDLTEEELPEKPGFARFIYRVSDTGIGMDEDFQKTLFDRFTRAVDTRINSVQGTGLGLSIVKQLIDLMGGTIEVESKLNVGSVFTVTLDLPVSDKKAEEVSLENMSALLIDDDKILLETAQKVLLKSGMHADVALSGKTGIEMAVLKKEKHQPYDVILVDYKMSEMNGVEVIAKLREYLGSSAKIIVMTAYNIADIEKEAYKAGADAFITKPLFPSKLLHTIQTLFTGEKPGISAQNKQSFDLKILVAEDNNVNWRVLKKLLFRYGLTPEWAENGMKAVEMVKDSEEVYDLILMDIQMPKMNGYEATKEIRALEDRKKAQTVIYAMTADTFAEDVEKCIQCGMNGHLSKPLEIEKLRKILEQLSQRKE